MQTATKAQIPSGKCSGEDTPSYALDSQPAFPGTRTLSLSFIQTNGDAFTLLDVRPQVSPHPSSGRAGRASIWGFQLFQWEVGSASLGGRLPKSRRGFNPGYLGENQRPTQWG